MTYYLRRVRILLMEHRAVHAQVATQTQEGRLFLRKITRQLRHALRVRLLQLLHALRALAFALLRICGCRRTTLGCVSRTSFALTETAYLALCTLLALRAAFGSGEDVGFV